MQLATTPGSVASDPNVVLHSDAPAGTLPGEIRVIADPDLQPLAQSLAEMAAEPREWLGLGVLDLTPLTLVVVPNSEAFGYWSRGRVPNWGAGLALPSRRLIIIRVDAGTPYATLRHELAHMAFHSVIHTRVPLWFAEGYAVLASGEHGGLDALQLNLAVALGRVPGLGQLDAALRGSLGDAGTAYALAAAAVAEVARRHPSRSLEPMLRSLTEGVPFDEALSRSTGMDTPAFGDAWNLAIRHRYNLGVWAVAGGAWAIVALILAVLMANRRRRDAPRRAALDDNWEIPREDDKPIIIDDGMMTVANQDSSRLDHPDHNC